MSQAGRNSAEIYTQAITKLRSQVWIGLMLISLTTLVAIRLLRILDGYTTPTPLGNVLLITFLIILIGGILLRHTRYAPYLQTLYIFALHLNIPFALLFFGGAQGIGDITFFATVMISLLFGVRRWMYLSFGISAFTLVYVLYLDLIGTPVATLVENTSRLASVKLLLFILMGLFTLYISNQFYRGVVKSYRRHAEEQIQINSALRETTQRLRERSADLQTARRKLVATREEERRRLRRDLHDGLGPTLAAQVFRVGAARNLFQKQPAKADGFLAEVETSVGGTLDDIKQLIDALRPPLLDQLGLIGAINDYTKQLQRPFAISLDLADAPPTLTAAAEVALWRIVQTSLDNVAQHAQATHCWIGLTAQDGLLQLSIADDGVGIVTDRLAGVGILSMQERMEELGGTLNITKRKPCGTVVMAGLQYDEL